MKWQHLVPPVLLILLWQLLSMLGVIPAYKLPPPSEIIIGLKDLISTGMPPGRTLFNHILYSLYRVFLGYAIAVGIAIPLGIAMGWSSNLRLTLHPVVELIRPIPPLAWIPISILWFGIGFQSAAFIIFLGSFFPILLNTTYGVLSIDRVLIEAARTLNAKDRDIFFKVLIPGAIPSIFTGLRIGMGIGWMTLVAAEFTGVRHGYGLGYMIMTARDLHQAEKILAGMLVIGIIGYFLDWLLRKTERKLAGWY